VAGKRGAVVFVGNEGNGMSESTIAACDQTVTIPMEGRAESLNAAVAASILMWELVRK
jgi:TrmH family RNA methyltransferase